MIATARIEMPDAFVNIWQLNWFLVPHLWKYPARKQHMWFE
jgi:hypothetical protein